MFLHQVDGHLIHTFILDVHSLLIYPERVFECLFQRFSVPLHRRTRETPFLTHISV